LLGGHEVRGGRRQWISGRKFRGTRHQRQALVEYPHPQKRFPCRVVPGCALVCPDKIIETVSRNRSPVTCLPLYFPSGVFAEPTGLLRRPLLSFVLIIILPPIELCEQWQYVARARSQASSTSWSPSRLTRTRARRHRLVPVEGLSSTWRERPGSICLPVPGKTESNWLSSPGRQQEMEPPAHSKAGLPPAEHER